MMKSTRICLVSLGCVASAFAFGVLANAAIDLVMPPGSRQIAIPAAVTPVEAAQPASFALASATSTPVDLGPVKIKTVPIIVRDGLFAEPGDEMPAASASTAIPLPRPRPASAPSLDSIANRPGSLAITAATHKAQPDDGDPLSVAGIDRMKMALALTAEQEEFWPAIASELRAIGKAMRSHKGQKISVDQDTMQRLYMAAAPLITRLSYEQKMKAKQMARLMGLNEVAEAL